MVAKKKYKLVVELVNNKMACVESNTIEKEEKERKRNCEDRE
jgi:hypothetical protein